MAARERVIASSAALADDGPGVRFEVAGSDGPVAAFAIRHEGVVHAYLNVCAHQGAELDWLAGEFRSEDGAHLICALHGALYDPATGACAGGPCGGGSLVKLAVRERIETQEIVIEGEPPAV